MAAIRVQSLADIVSAYFKSLGFSGKNLEKAVAALLTKHRFEIETDDVIAALEEILQKNLDENFADVDLPDMSKRAWFKTAFLLLDGAEKWGVGAFTGEIADKDYAGQIKGLNLCQVPGYKVSHMAPQKIEPPHPLKVFSRIFRGFYRNKK